jgi:PiT family inorganic phosphate transporter
VGAALAEGGLDAIRWGGLDGWRPVGVFGVLIALAFSPLLGLGFGFGFVRRVRRLLHRATRRVRSPIRTAQWAMSPGLSFSHGANDTQKAMGVIGALLVADDRFDTFGVPLWAMLACGVALTAGTLLGGSRIVRTIGRRIFRLAPVRCVCQSGSFDRRHPCVLLRRAPVSTTQVQRSTVERSLR